LIAGSPFSPGAVFLKTYPTLFIFFEDALSRPFPLVLFSPRLGVPFTHSSFLLGESFALFSGSF